MSLRGWRAVLLAVALELVVAALVVTSCTSGPPPFPREAGPSTTSRAAGPLDAVFDRWWAADGYGCASQTAIVVDDLAGHVVAEMPEVPVLDARLAAAGYVRRHCAG